MSVCTREATFELAPLLTTLTLSEEMCCGFGAGRGVGLGWDGIGCGVKGGREELHAGGGRAGGGGGSGRPGGRGGEGG